MDQSHLPLCFPVPLGTNLNFCATSPGSLEDNIRVNFDISDTLLREKLASCADGSFTRDPALPTATTIADNSSASLSVDLTLPDTAAPCWENLAEPDDLTMPSESQREALFFKDTCSSPAKAVLLFYINSGHFRFDQYKDYCSKYNNEDVDIDRLKQDIRDEQLTDNEYDAIIRRFYKLHPYTNFDIQACSCCGLRQIERLEDPVISFIPMPLSHPFMGVLKYTPAQEADFRSFAESPRAIVTIPINDQWETSEVNLVNIRSFHPQNQLEGPPQLWHLHPELVHMDSEECPHAMLCPVCHDSVTGGKLPSLSIANGIDLVCPPGLGLTQPNLHEQLMLARTRLYFAMLKVSSNTKGQVNDNLSNSARCHAILFPHNSTEVATYMYGAMLQGHGGILEEIKSNLKDYFMLAKF